MDEVPGTEQQSRVPGTQPAVARTPEPHESDDCSALADGPLGITLRVKRDGRWIDCSELSPFDKETPPSDKISVARRTSPRLKTSVSYTSTKVSATSTSNKKNNSTSSSSRNRKNEASSSRGMENAAAGTVAVDLSKIVTNDDVDKDDVGRSAGGNDAVKKAASGKDAAKKSTACGRFCLFKNAADPPARPLFVVLLIVGRQYTRNASRRFCRTMICNRYPIMIRAAQQRSATQLRRSVRNPWIL